MFARRQRLTRQKDVQRVYKNGVSAASRWLFIRSLPNRLSETRMTVVIGKKVAKKAVDRNRLKRLVRQSVQELMTEPTFTDRIKSKDLVLTLHKSPEYPYDLATIKPEVEKCFARLP